MSPFKSVCPRELSSKVLSFSLPQFWAKPPNHTLSQLGPKTVVFNSIHRLECYAYNRGHELAGVLGALGKSS